MPLSYAATVRAWDLKRTIVSTTDRCQGYFLFCIFRVGVSEPHSWRPSRWDRVPRAGLTRTRTRRARRGRTGLTRSVSAAKGSLRSPVFDLQPVAPEFSSCCARAEAGLQPRIRQGRLSDLLSDCPPPVRATHRPHTRVSLKSRVSGQRLSRRASQTDEGARQTCVRGRRIKAEGKGGVLRGPRASACTAVWRVA